MRHKTKTKLKISTCVLYLRTSLNWTTSRISKSFIRWLSKDFIDESVFNGIEHIDYRPIKTNVLIYLYKNILRDSKQCQYDTENITFIVSII